MPLYTDSLPDFPWDTLTPYAETARRHPGGIIDLSVGTPVDPTPQVVADAILGAAQAPGYPPTIGTPELRAAMVAWWRRRGAVGVSEQNVLPTLGSKEAVALLPAMLGVGPGDAVLHPSAAYPTYDVGARLAGALPVPVDIAAPETWADAVRAAAAGVDGVGTTGGNDLGGGAAVGGRVGVREACVGSAGALPRIALVWVNSPGNPDGSVLGAETLARIVRAARECGAVVASDECYAELGFDAPWDETPVPSVLDARALGTVALDTQVLGAQVLGAGVSCGEFAGSASASGEETSGRGVAPDYSGVLALYSLSKQSNMAGHRAAMIAGDPELIAELRELRKHAGFMQATSTQAAMTAGLNDDAHVAEQRERYRRRRETLLAALPAAGLVKAEQSVAGLYLWLTVAPERAAELADEGRSWDSWDLVGALAERGILVAPGAFYGDEKHVRLGLNASDEQIADAAARLREGPLL